MVRKRRWCTLLALVLSAASCSDNSTPTGPPYDPELPDSWAVGVTNPFFPLVPGTTYRYQAETDEGMEVIVVEVLSNMKVVNGVNAMVVRDRVSVDGELVEDTFDWYGQDSEGNVWYLGEDSKEIEDGVVVSTEGSWEWMVDGALPGVIMWADPGAHMGEEYRQEYYEDEAEDWARVVGVDETVVVPYGTYSGCIRTEDWNGLEPGTLEEKSYCPGIGFTREVMVQGGGEVVELIEVTP